LIIINMPVRQSGQNDVLDRGTSMKLTSPNFGNQQAIPGKYAFCVPDPSSHVTFAGNRNPAFRWSGVPADTRSFALLCIDPDAPSKADDVNREDREVPADLPRADFCHWVLVDLPACKTGIEEGEFSDGVVTGGKDGPQGPNGTRQGLNNYTDWFAADPDMQGQYFGYDGPCPPWNDSIPHRYIFTLYALDVERCPLDGVFGSSEFLEAVGPHIMAEASYGGTYCLNPDVLS
jgi:Raf kinase inhibitor-like YbhB/YbcL family protein